MAVNRCTAPNCGDERPIVILAQGVAFHYDGDDKTRAIEEALKLLESN